MINRYKAFWGNLRNVVSDGTLLKAAVVSGIAVASLSVPQQAAAQRYNMPPPEEVALGNPPPPPAPILIPYWRAITKEGGGFYVNRASVFAYGAGAKLTSETFPKGWTVHCAHWSNGRHANFSRDPWPGATKYCYYGFSGDATRLW